MPSNRLAFLSVAVGSALLGWATAGVSAIGADLPSDRSRTTTPTVVQPHHHHDRGDVGRPGV